MVSPVTTRTSSIETPTVAAATWARIVSVPCPCSVMLEMTVSLPDGSSRIVVPSCDEMRAQPIALCAERPVAGQVQHRVERFFMRELLEEEPGGRGVGIHVRGEEIA